MMKFLMVMFMVLLGVVADENVKNHNGAHHKALCELLKSAVNKWGQVKSRESTDPLKIALHKTIFGYGSHEQEVEELRSTFPKDYHNVGGFRNYFCGEPYNDPQNYQSPRWSGHSAPHDMVCLCTAGKDGWPLNISDTEKLCGKNKIYLGVTTNEGWGYNEEGDAGEKQIEATWTNVTKDCLQEDVNGKELNEALKDFKGKLLHNPDQAYSNRDLLGEGGKGYSACNGNGQVCVMYYTTLTANTWWVDLEKALIEDEKTQKERDEEAKRKQEEAAKKEAQKTETLNSGHPTTNQTQQNNHHSNLTEKLRRYNLTSGTPIILHRSWLPSALLLI